MPTASEELEKRFQGILEGFGLRGWTLVWEPDETQPKRGQILPNVKTIIVYDEEPEAAIETLIHEVLEIKLRPMLKPYRTLVNSLITWADSQVYHEKERVIEDILQLVKFNEEHPSKKNLEEVSRKK